MTLGDEEVAHDPNGRVGFRDIYRAVGESEARIITALNAAVAPLSDAARDHEARLRILEAAVGPLAIAAADKERRLTAVEVQADTTTKQIGTFVDRERGVFATLGAGKTLVLVVAGVVGTVLTVINFILSLRLPPTP